MTTAGNDADAGGSAPACAPSPWPGYLGVGLATSFIALLLEQSLLAHHPPPWRPDWVGVVRVGVMLLPWAPAVVLLARRLLTRRNTHWLAYTCGAALPFAVIAAFLYGPGVVEHLQRRDFDAAAWKAAAYGSDEREPTEDRLRMVDDLIDSRLLVDKTRAEVQALLGVDDGPEGTGYYGWRELSTGEAVYYLGRERGFLFGGVKWLLIRYGEDDRVRSIRVTTQGD